MDSRTFIPPLLVPSVGRDDRDFGRHDDRERDEPHEEHGEEDPLFLEVRPAAGEKTHDELNPVDP